MALIANSKKVVSGDNEKQLAPSTTSLHCGLKFNFSKGYPEIVLDTKSSAVVRGVVVSAEKIFENDSFA